ncbi:PREDICTED: putative disease resistance protein RGA3 [Populus euphratica]|uniref:Disease resistance protein RGA3 n=1 Tax=Populus euphratica TaxID=75702 RepID=A0AAJ6Y204_POPEU|nr:PREDICTED: putative disease resistance protein RGA3 [Populus euphratica]
MAHLVSELLELLSSIRFYEVKQEVRLVVGVKEEVKNLTRKLQSVKLEVADAERRWRHAQDKSAKEWLDDFEEICYGLDDVLDEWVNAILKSETEYENSKTESEYENPNKSKRKLKIHSSRFTCGQVSLRDDIASKMKKLNEKANGFFGRKEPKFEKSIQYYATAVDETSVCGREKEKDKLIKLLLGESTDQGGRSSDVISIVGIAGVGKTYLAELVYEEKNRVGLNDLLEETALAIFGKKFLLVLDDVLEIDSFMWHKYLKCYFEFGLPGSKVLITTRSDMVPVSMGNHTCLFPLHGITEDDCRSLFSHRAWFGNSSTESEDMVSIHNKIISGCKGLPFLVKALVSLLQVKISTEERQHVLDSKVWDQYKDKPGYPPLLLCYDDLPPKMRRCFTYCALFSKDFKKLEQEYWINLWMAQGYLRATQIKEEELVGKDYFENLIARSFFQNAIKDGNGSTAACKVHDLVHEFAQFLTENDCVNVEVSSHGVIGMVSSWKKVRHLKIEFSERNASFPVSFDSLKNLRSLLVDYRKSDYPIVRGNQDDLLSRLTCLRALKLSHISIEKHLKYLPEEIGELYNLQTLNLSGCCELRRLPYGLFRLINLRHLNNYHTDKLTFMPRGIERLTSLKSLYKFVVNCSYHSHELSSTLGDLQNLNDLRKYLEISGLGNSKDVISEARKAQLKKKKQLVTLKLSFVECRALMHDQDEEIIQALEPPPISQAVQDLYLQVPKLQQSASIGQTTVP